MRLLLTEKQLETFKAGSRELMKHLRIELRIARKSKDKREIRSIKIAAIDYLIYAV